MTKYSAFVHCGHEGCKANVSYEADTRKEQTALYVKYGQGRYRCVRHSQPDSVLSAERPKIVHEEVSVEQFAEHRGTRESIGLYFGHFGFVSGPGFKVFAKDFPVGTTLRVTAEIILPESEDQP